MSARELTTTAYILLGLLSARDWSAYQLAEQLGRGVDKFWPRADRQRYAILARLREEGLVDAREEATGRRSRTVYSITDAGRAALSAWLDEASRPPALEFEGMVRLLLSETGTIEGIRRTITSIRDQAVEDRAVFVGIAMLVSETGGIFPQRRHLTGLVNTYMIGHFDHMIAWADWALEESASWDDASSPAADGDASRRLLMRRLSDDDVG